MDLIVRRARIPGGHGVVDIGVAKGRIARISEAIRETGAHEVDARGRVVIPGLVESHFHLDKALRAIRRADYGLAEGARADLVVLDCAEPAAAVAAIPERAAVIKDGAVVVTNRVETVFSGPPAR